MRVRSKHIHANCYYPKSVCIFCFASDALLKFMFLIYLSGTKVSVYWNLDACLTWSSLFFLFPILKTIWAKWFFESPSRWPCWLDRYLVLTIGLYWFSGKYGLKMSMLVQVRMVIKGRVQGVCYRNWTVENAETLGLKGWVRNRRDGSVEALFSGPPEAVEEMQQRCRRGPPAAMVTGLEAFPSTEEPGTSFEYRSTV